VCSVYPWFLNQFFLLHYNSYSKFVKNKSNVLSYNNKILNSKICSIFNGIISTYLSDILNGNVMENIYTAHVLVI